jgi:probable rRNA maturation factor
MMTLEPPRGVHTEAEGWLALQLSRVGLTRFLKTARLAAGLPGEVDVLLAGDRTLRRLNREFRGKDHATDVLSFPAPIEVAAEHAGDLAISLETARKQGEEHGHSLAVEVKVLLLHGLLHLAGMDHEVDGGDMAAREAELRRKLRLPSSLIARVHGKAKKAVV